MKPKMIKAISNKNPDFSYKKFIVPMKSNQGKRFNVVVFENQGVFLNSKTRTPFNTIEEAVAPYKGTPWT